LFALLHFYNFPVDPKKKKQFVSYIPNNHRTISCTCSVCDPVPVIFNFPPGVAVSLSLVFELRDMVCLDVSSGTGVLSVSKGPSPAENCRL